MQITFADMQMIWGTIESRGAIFPASGEYGAAGAVGPRRSDPPARRNSEARQRAADEPLDVIPRDAGPHLATRRGGAIYSVRPAGSHGFLAKHHSAEIMLAPAPRSRAVLGTGEIRDYDAESGSILLHPANLGGSLAWPAIRESVIIVLTPEGLRELAAHEFDAGGVQLRPPPLGTVDPWALRIAQMLKAELTQREAPNELYVDSLVTLFGVHVLRHYSGIRTPPPAVRGGLSALGARQVQDYLAGNFSRKVSVAELAAISGLSPRHFIQAFTRTFGEPPHRHVVGLRLAFAEKLLAEGNLTIAEVAYLSGFSSQSHLTTAMKTYRQTTPMQIRREGSSPGATMARSGPMPGP